MTSTPKLDFLGRVGDVEVWSVDGYEVRKNIEIEFTNFAHHYRFPVIPENEIWVDHEASDNESLFFFAHCVVERALMKKGIDYQKALEIANEVELELRRKEGDPELGPKEVESVKKSLLSTLPDGTTLWRVDGRKIRSGYDINFTEGGHEYVYKYVPAGEVWIDDDLTPKDVPFVILHELLEQQLMRKGYAYPHAHKVCSGLEQAMRNAPELYSAMLKIVTRGAALQSPRPEPAVPEETLPSVEEGSQSPEA